MKAIPRGDPGQKSGQVMSGSSPEQPGEFRAAGERESSFQQGCLQGKTPQLMTFLLCRNSALSKSWAMNL